jgi:hypothetical protein
MRRVQINTYSQSNLALAISPFSQPIPNNRNYRNKTENGLTILAKIAQHAKNVEVRFKLLLAMTFSHCNQRGWIVQNHVLYLYFLHSEYGNGFNINIEIPRPNSLYQKFGLNPQIIPQTFQG